MKKILLLTFALSLLTNIFAQIPSGYYNGTEGLEGEGLREKLRSIITSGHSTNSYGDLYDYYESTDNYGSNKVWDMYSMDVNGNASYYYYFNSNDECGSYTGEGDCYNREHSVPASWFDDDYPMYADLFMVIPTDGYVNNRRSNYPFGEVGSATWTSTNGSKVGSCSYSGYSSTVFEPIDDFKGDFAREYFYVATRYKNQLSSWSGASFSGNNFSTWTKNMLLEWHENDPLSQKEIDRNNAVHDIQHNRNPFIDYPEWVECIWGDGCPTSVEDIAGNTITIFPNPTNNNLTVSSRYDITSITIYGIIGNVALNIMNNKSNKLSFDISTLSNGIYFVEITDNHNNKILKKLIKE